MGVIISLRYENDLKKTFSAGMIDLCLKDFSPGLNTSQVYKILYISRLQIPQSYSIYFVEKNIYLDNMDFPKSF